MDITASSEKRNIIFDVVKKTAQKCFMPLTVGGGVRSIKDIRKLLLCGADKVSINTAAIKNPKLVQESSAKFGNQCIVVAIDAKKIKKNKWEIYTHGGRKRTGIDAITWAKKMEKLGAGEILLTSMDKDGTKSGFDTNLLRKVSEFLNIPLIASGGVGTLEHFYEGVKIGKANALLAASVFHFNEISIKEVKEYLFKKNIEIRL